MGNNNTGYSSSSAVSQLTDLGFDQSQARRALEATGGNVQQAAELLLGSPSDASSDSVQTPRVQGGSSAVANLERQQLQAALAASQREETERQKRARAAEARSRAAAVSHSNRTPATGRATVKPASQAPRATRDLPQERPEDRLRRLASTLAAFPQAIDILITSLDKVIKNPNDQKYRRVPLHNKNFQENVAIVPGGLDFLKTLGYLEQNHYLVLQRMDPALMWMGKSILSETRDKSVNYQEAKEAQLLTSAIEQSKDEYARHKRQQKASLRERVPKEPPEGTAGCSLLCFHVGSHRVWRRFESSDTLEDIFNFVGSLEELEWTHWQLTNITLTPPAVLPVEKRGTTLQNLDLWPSGQVLVQCA